MKKSYYAVIALFVGVAILAGGILVYVNKGTKNMQNNTTEQNEPSSVAGNEEGQAPEYQTTFEGKTVTANPNYQVGLVDGKLAADPDLQNNTIVVDVDVKKIFPDMPVDKITVTISVEGAGFFLKDESGESQEIAFSDLKAGDPVNVGFIDGQSNRDVLSEGASFRAKHVYKFIVK